jgi:KUP system potassium uptake protein
VDLGDWLLSAVAVLGAWLLIVFPALTLNHLGQGALILEHPGAATNPFYLLVPTRCLSR